MATVHVKSVDVDTNESRKLLFDEIKNDTIVEDVLLVAKDNQEVRAHRLILSARSKYFRKIFTNLSPVDRNLKIPVDGKVLGNIKNYIYSGEIELGAHNVEAVLVNAKRLELENLIKACETFMSMEMNAANCLQFWTVAHNNDCKSLELKAKAYVNDNFGEKEFSKLDNKRLRELLKLKKSNGFVVLAVMTSYHRGIHIQQCSNLRDEWTAWTTLYQDQNRHWFGVALMDGELIIAGGRTDKDKSKIVATVTSTNIKTSTSKLLKPMGTCRMYVSLVVLDNSIYAIGGKDTDNKWLKSVERWDRETDLWTEIEPMTEEKKGQNAAVLNGRIYVIGGSNKKPEYYNPLTHNWTFEAEMHDTHCWPGVAVLNNKLWVVGGSGSAMVECFNGKIWTKMCSLNSPRYGLGCIAMMDRIVVVGGSNNGEKITTIEEYIPKDQKWIQWETKAIYCYGCTLVLATDISTIQS